MIRIKYLILIFLLFGVPQAYAGMSATIHSPETHPEDFYMWDSVAEIWRPYLFQVNADNVIVQRKGKNGIIDYQFHDDLNYVRFRVAGNQKGRSRWRPQSYYSGWKDYSSITWGDWVFDNSDPTTQVIFTRTGTCTSAGSDETIQERWIFYYDLVSPKVRARLTDENTDLSRMAWEVQEISQITDDANDVKDEFGEVPLEVSYLSSDIILGWHDFGNATVRVDEVGASNMIRVSFYKDGETGVITIDPTLDASTSGTEVTVSNSDWGTDGWQMVWDTAKGGAVEQWYHDDVGSGSDDMTGNWGLWEYNILSTDTADSLTITEDTDARVQVEAVNTDFEPSGSDITVTYTIYPTGYVFNKSVFVCEANAGLDYWFSLDDDYTNDPFRVDDDTNICDAIDCDGGKDFSICTYSNGEYGGVHGADFGGRMYFYLDSASNAQTSGNTYTYYCQGDFSCVETAYDSTDLDNRRNDYQNPDTPAFTKGSIVGDGYDEGEGCYTMDADSNSDCSFVLEYDRGASTDYAFYHLAFKITNYTNAHLPVVYEDETQLVSGVDYNICFINNDDNCTVDSDDADAIIINLLGSYSEDVDIDVSTMALLECRAAATPVASVDNSGNIWTAAMVIIDDLLCILESVGDACYTIINGNDNASDITFTLPIDDDNANEALSTNGSGVLSWIARANGSTTLDAICENGATTDANLDLDGTVAISANSVGGNTIIVSEATHTASCGSMSVTNKYTSGTSDVFFVNIPRQANGVAVNVRDVTFYYKVVSPGVIDEYGLYVGDTTDMSFTSKVCVTDDLTSTSFAEATFTFTDFAMAAGEALAVGFKYDFGVGGEIWITSIKVVYDTN